MGALRQEQAEGMLALEQNDGIRRIHWSSGDIIFVQSDVAGEQFGNYLLRQGVLDFPALSELLANEEHFRLGEKVVQWGLMSLQERDAHLCSLQEQIMVHALEHPIIEMEWHEGTQRSQLSEDLHLKFEHRRFVWTTFHEAHNLRDLCDLLYAENAWRWVAPSDVLNLLGDLPLNPRVAYALSFWGPEPIGYETFLSLTGMDEGDGARLLAALWALGGIVLSQGAVPSPRKVLPPPSAPPIPPVPCDTPLPPVPTVAVDPVPPPTPVPPASPELAPPEPLEFLPANAPRIEPGVPIVPEMIQPESDPENVQESPQIRARKYFLKARTLLLQERMAEAIRMLEQSVKLDPDTEHAYEPWLLLGKHRASNPAWSTRAIEALQTASKLRPRAAEPWSLMGEIYHRKNFKANARACFRRALELDPSIPIPPDVDLREEEPDTEERDRSGLLNRFKSLLGRQDKD
jgi:tetratricopeptide (TPR) repeat protein